MEDYYRHKEESYERYKEPFDRAPGGSEGEVPLEGACSADAAVFHGSLSKAERDDLPCPSDLFSDRLKREERRREELYRQYYEEIKRRFDAERPVDCSVIVVNKQTK